MRNRVLFQFFTMLNKVLPKYNRVMIHGNTNLDDNAIEIAKSIRRNSNIPIVYAASGQYLDYVSKLLPENIRLVKSSTPFYMWLYMTSKYVFFTTGSFLNSFSKGQVAINVWHGILYKRIKKLRGLPGIPANITVATSPLTQKMFSEAFGVKPADVFISGYPRNDVILKGKDEKSGIQKKLGFEAFDKLILWMPTFRQNNIKGLPLDGNQMDNPFNLEHFDEDAFNVLLKQHNTLCLVKPHPAAEKLKGFNNLENLQYINDLWIAKNGITLYELLGASDILLSDVSSVIIDYLLLDQPVLCVCSDLKEYQDTRGFYFENIRDWLPSPVLTTQKELSLNLERLLISGIDPLETKRNNLKNKFFSKCDTNSAERLVNRVFGVRQ